MLAVELGVLSEYNGAFELFRVCLFSATADAVPILTSNLAKAFDQPFRGLNQMT